ncbi:MAG: GNAT family N-acetyltransferase [Sphingomonas taxi]|uniref:GNAT family N-acetyltransferase n=1 Tax=Sphingomonas taxi TaxID=1549858 RepID=A0A2W5PC39_9SPHN|nr:MAG: GNAT family N-acetyltransferase [Sphingomonas taxi]
MQIRKDDPANPALAALLDAHVAEQRAMTPPGFAFALDAGALAAPDITFWSAWDGDLPIGMGALRALDRSSGEVKSMRATRRGLGVGHAILSAIIAEARGRGYVRLSLETGTTAAYEPALALYRRAGFVPCDAFAGYAPSPHNQFLTLAL